MHDQAGENVRVRVRVKYNGFWKVYDGLILVKPTFYKSDYIVEFVNENGLTVKCPLVSGLEGPEVKGIVEILTVQEEEEEEDQEDDEDEQEEEEEEAVQEDDVSEGAADTARDAQAAAQGKKIGKFWSGITYKWKKLNVRVVGQENNGVYWVRQWQPKNRQWQPNGKNWTVTTMSIREKK